MLHPRYRALLIGLLILSLRLSWESTPRSHDSPRVSSFDSPLPHGAIGRLGSEVLRHVGAVSALAFSPDGNVLATGGRTSVRLWRTSTGKELRRWRFSAVASALAFSPDGKVLAVGGPYLSVRLLEVTSGRELDRFDGIGWSVNGAGPSLAFSPDGKTLAVGSGGTVGFWGLATGARLRKLEGNFREVSAIAFVPSGNIVAVGCEQGLRLYDSASGKLLRTLTEGSVSSLAFSPDGAHLAAIDRSYQGFFLWRTATGKKLRHFRLLHDPLRLAFSPDGKTVASVPSHYNSICLTDLETGNHRWLSDGSRQQGILALAFSPDGKVLTSGGEDRQARLWDVAAGKERALGAEEVDRACLSQSGKVAATLGGDRTIRLWEVPSGRLLRKVGTGACESCLALSSDGTLLASCDKQNGIVVYDAETRELRRRCGKQRGWSGWWVWVAFSPDGKLLASGGDGDVSLWDVATGQQRHHLKGHTNGTMRAAFSPDGKTLATASMDGTIRFWSVATGKEVHRLKAHGGLGVRHLCFSADGKFLASGGDNSFLCLWDTTTYRRVGHFPMQGEHSAFVALSPDGRVIASNSEAGAFSLWDVATGKTIGHFSGHQAEINSAVFGPDGKRLLTGSQDGTTLVWDLAAPPLVPVARPRLPQADCYGDPLPPGAHARLGTQRFCFEGWVQSCAFSPDSKTLAISTGGFMPLRPALVLLDAATGKEVHNFGNWGTSGTRLVFSPNGKLLATATGASISLWCPARGVRLDHFLGHAEAVSSFVFSPDSKILAVGGQERNDGKNHTILLWDVAAGRELRHLGGHAKTVRPLAFSQDGKTLASGSDGEVRFWDVGTGKRLRDFKAPGTVIAFAPDLGPLIVGAKDKDVILWDVQQGKEVRRLRDVGDNLLLAPDGKTLAAGGRDRALGLWDLRTGKKIQQFRGPEGSGSFVQCFSPDGKTLISGLRLWDVSTGQERRPAGGHAGSVGCVAFTPDGNEVVSGSADRTVRCWEAKTGKELRRYGEHQNAVGALAVSPDGQTVASGDSSGAVHLWQRTTGKRRHSFPGPPAKEDASTGVTSLHFTPDGKKLIAVGTGTVRVWDVQTGKGLREVEGQSQWSRGAALAPDGRTLAYTSDGDSWWEPVLHFWDLDTRKEVGRITETNREELDRFDHPQITFGPVAFSLDGQFLAVGRSVFRRRSSEHQIVLFEVATRQELLRIDTAGRAQSLLFGPDGRTLLIGEGGGWWRHSNTPRVWDLFARKEVARLAGHTRTVLSLALSPDGQVLASGSADGTALLRERNWPERWRPWQDVRLGPRQQQAVWDDLASPEAARAHRAARKLLDVPDQAATLLRTRLRPAPPGADAQRLGRMITDLDADEFEVREKAREELEEQGELAEPALRRAIKRRSSLEAQRRMELLLARLEGTRTAPERLRTIRAIGVLERLGTPEGRGLLTRLASGAPDALLTRKAKASLRRLNKEPKSRTLPP